MRNIFIILLISLLAVAGVSAQSTRDIRINEILVKNVDNYEDDYGHRSSWVELYNTGHSKLNIGGCYFRMTTTDGQEFLYRIPTGDPRTEIGPLGYSIFFCEGTGTKGTFYTNFTLDNVKRLELLNASGKGEPIDMVEIDYAKQLPDVSIGYMTHDDGKVIFGPLPQTTPNATNDTEPIMARSERFRLMDPYGGKMALIAVIVVLSVLCILFLCFKLLGTYMVYIARKKNEKASKVSKGVTDEAAEKVYVSPDSGDEIAAIAMALQMFQDELHDKESSVITINRVARAYSPWSSKIYGLNQFNKKQ